MKAITRKRFLLLATASAFTFALGGCVEDDGPAEEAGEAVDDAVEEAGDKIENATDG